MSIRRTLFSYHHYYTILKHQSPSSLPRLSLTSPIHLSSFSNVQEIVSTMNPRLRISLFQRNFCACLELVSEAVIEDKIDGESTGTEESSKKLENKKKKVGKGEKNLDVQRKGVVNLSEKLEKNGPLQGEVKKSKEVEELKKKIQKLEMEVRGLRKNVQSTENNKKKKGVESLKNEEHPTVQAKPISLHALFTSKPQNLHILSAIYKQEKEKVSVPVKTKPLQKSKPIRKELLPEMVALARHWHEEGYFREAKVGSTREFDDSLFDHRYSHDFLRYVAEQFGRDHQEIAKWLSGSDLKTVALFGCPTVEKKQVFAAKRLRTFFHIQEDVACRACKLKSSCKYVNQKVWRKMDNFNMEDAMRVLISYSLAPDPQLAITEEVKASINRLLKEVLSLSK